MLIVTQEGYKEARINEDARGDISNTYMYVNKPLHSIIIY